MLDCSLERPGRESSVRGYRAWVRWGAVALWAGVIFGFSSLHGSQVPGRFGPAAHFIEYAVLGGLLFAAVSPGRDYQRSVLVAIALASLYAVSDEFHQSFVPLRTPDPVDWLVDTVGATVGALAAAAALRRARINAERG
jgi:VanZ family protein